MEVNKIYNESNLDTMAKMPDNFVDLVVTSPPYDNLRTYTNDSEWTFELFQKIAKELYRVVKQGGVVVWVVGDATIKGSETCTSFKQALYFRECGFNLHDTMIWKKKNPFNFGSNNCYIQDFEYMFVFSKGKPNAINLIYDRENESVKNGNTDFFYKSRKGDFIKYNKDKIRHMSLMGKRHNVWEMGGSTNYKTHTATFPEELASDHIKSWSNENDLVYDPFSGSGTTAKMAHLLNRNFIGSEISKEYYELSLKRLEPYMQQLSLF